MAESKRVYGASLRLDTLPPSPSARGRNTLPARLRDTDSLRGGKLALRSITTEHLAFTAVDSGEIIATINASAEGIDITADRISISGLTTFDTGYDPSTKETPSGAQAKADAAQDAAETYTNAEVAAGKLEVGAIIRSATTPTMRVDGSVLQAGDLWIETDNGDATYSWSGSTFIRTQTQIDGGYITTGVIDAQFLSIDGTATFASGYDPTTKETPAGAQAKADAAEAAAEAYTDALESSLGSLAFDDLVETAKLGTTVIQGGFLVTSLIAAKVIGVQHLVVGSFDNLASNPGFETGNFGNHTTVASGGSWSVTTNAPRSGAESAEYDPTGQTADAELRVNGGLENQHAITEGDSIYFEAWARSNTGASSNRVHIQIRWYDETTVISTTSSSAVMLTTAYQKISHAGTAPAGTVTFQVRVIVIDDGFTNRIHIDDFYARRMVEGSIVLDGTLTVDKLAFPAVDSDEIIATINASTEGIVIEADNIELDGTVEVGANLQSSNYAAGTTGWIIDGNGDAEFNDVTIRGVLDAATGSFEGDVVIESPATLTVGLIEISEVSGEAFFTWQGNGSVELIFQQESLVAAGIEVTGDVFRVSTTDCIIENTLVIGGSGEIENFRVLTGATLNGGAIGSDGAVEGLSVIVNGTSYMIPLYTP